MIPKIIRFSKVVKECVKNFPFITGILFEKQDFLTDWIVFYWLQNNETKSRNNESIKIKDMRFDFFIETLRNIFPHLQILTT